MISAQLITKFTWENNPPTQAAYGPNAISISSSATVSPNGAGGTNGLNPGAQTDINMVLTGSNYQLPGLDISVDFKREESQASFFTMGLFDFGMNGGTLYAKYALVKGSGDTVVNATNLYSLPSDNKFHTYRFVYNNYTGVATVYVDGTSVYSAMFGTDPALYWTGAGNATVGSLMDGTGSNIAILDNLIIQSVPNIILPVRLLSFGAQRNGAKVDLNWATVNETSGQPFVVERSVNGSSFEEIGSSWAADSTGDNRNYAYTDNAPLEQSSYYRVKVLEAGNTYTYSDVKKVNGSQGVEVSFYPNPVVDKMNIHAPGNTRFQYQVVTMEGRTLQTGMVAVAGQTASLDLSSAPKGILVVRIQEASGGYSASFKVLKM
jgi:hypothetical protein